MGFVEDVYIDPRILLVDDDPNILTTSAEILGDHGFECQKARSRLEALHAIEHDGPWDVIVLDENLSGPGGPSTATSLLAEIAGLDPAARTIVVTGFATPALVKSALDVGAWDYLQKEALFLGLLLPLRVRHAVEVARERRLRHYAPADLERELRATWTQALAPETTSARKGRLLEETLALLFRTMPGLDNVTVNRRGPAEEFDVVVVNASTDPVLQKEGTLFLVECKNWKAQVDPDALSRFRDKLRNRFDRVKLGFLTRNRGASRPRSLRRSSRGRGDAPRPPPSTPPPPPPGRRKAPSAAGAFPMPRRLFHGSGSRRPGGMGNSSGSAGSPRASPHSSSRRPMTPSSSSSSTGRR